MNSKMLLDTCVVMSFKIERQKRRGLSDDNVSLASNEDAMCYVHRETCSRVSVFYDGKWCFCLPVRLSWTWKGA